MTSLVAAPRSSSKALPKAKLAPKKGHVTVWWSAAGLIHYSSLNPGETIASEKYAQQISMRCTDNFNAFRWYWSTKWAKLFSTTMPNHTLHNQCFKSRMNWAMKFCLIHHIHLTSCQLTTTSQQLFAGKMFPQPAGSRKCFPSVR